MVMAKELISIIVPVYNVEQYLRRCIESICSQTYRNIEIFLIDDGSTDSSGKICDEYAIKDGRIKVIHQENSGVSASRNKALDIAEGSFIMFIDSDDWIHYQMIEILYNNILKSGSDISVCNIECTESFKKDKFIDGENMPYLMYSNVEAINNLLTSRYGIFWGSVWCKLYKKELFENIRFPYGQQYGEDTWIAYHVYDACNKISFIDFKLYYYFTNGSGAMNKQYSIERLSAYYTIKYMFFYIKDKEYKELYTVAYNLMLGVLINNYCQIMTYIEDNKEFKKTLKSDFSELYCMPERCGLSLKNRIKYWLFKHNSYFYYYMHECYVRFSLRKK